MVTFIYISSFPNGCIGLDSDGVLWQIIGSNAKFVKKKLPDWSLSKHSGAMTKLTCICQHEQGIMALDSDGCIWKLITSIDRWIYLGKPDEHVNQPKPEPKPAKRRRRPQQPK